MREGYDSDFDDIVEEWEQINMVEINVEVDRDDDILAPIKIEGNGHKVVDIDFDSLPEVWKPFVRCHHHQRERLEYIARKYKWHYEELIKRCSKVIGRKVRDSGEMSFGEAERCIDILE